MTVVNPSKRSQVEEAPCHAPCIWLLFRGEQKECALLLGAPGWFARARRVRYVRHCWLTYSTLVDRLSIEVHGVKVWYCSFPRAWRVLLCFVLWKSSSSSPPSFSDSNRSTKYQFCLDSKKTNFYSCSLFSYPLSFAANIHPATSVLSIRDRSSTR
jgi:hypothetical protein